MTDASSHPATIQSRRRLSGRTERRGSQTGFPSWGAFAFGAVFVAVGTLIVLVGQRVIPTDPSSVRAPWWVLTVAGASFGGGGLAVWGMALTQFRAETHRRAAARRYAGSVALNDYAWDIRGERSRQWKRAVQALGGALFMTVFLSMFNWWAFGAAGPWMLKAIVILFDLILVLVWWEAAVRVGRAVKFGGSLIMFDHFSYAPGETVVLRWVPPHGAGRATRGEFTLRCVEEFYEQRGTGKNASSHMVHEEITTETQSFDSAQTFVPGREVNFSFAVAIDAPSTCLSGAKPVFWEFEVKLSMTGLDFEERYLVPIYRPAA